jgi:2-methylcitrate dehydratase
MPHGETTTPKTLDRDALLAGIAEHVTGGRVDSDVAYDAARHCLADSLACAFQALRHPDCTRLLGPLVPGATMAGGARVPGTSFELDPVRAAFNIGTMVRWLDANDASFASAWGHPSDNLGGILALADYLGRKALAEGRPGPAVRDVLAALIRAHELQGLAARAAGVAGTGSRRVIPIRIATAAVATVMLGGTPGQVVEATSDAWSDGDASPALGHAPGAGPRKGWAVGDATSRGVWHALNALRDVASVGEAAGMGAEYPVTRGLPTVDAMPALVSRLESSVAGAFPAAQAAKIRALFADTDSLDAMPVSAFVASLVRN